MDKKPMASIMEPSTRPANAKQFAEEFKRDKVRLVTEGRYSFKAAAGGRRVLCLRQLARGNRSQRPFTLFTLERHDSNSANLVRSQCGGTNGECGF